nr:retropepsin-like aspartic protease [Morganella morganii]
MSIIQKIIPATSSLLLISGCANIVQEEHSPYNNPVYSYSVSDHYSSYILVPVTINNKTYPFILDTGTSVTIVDSSLISDAGLEKTTLPAAYKNYFSDMTIISGKIDGEKLKYIRPPLFRIGDYPVTHNDIWIDMPLEKLREVTCENIRGLLGMDIINKFNWEIDKKNQTIRLFTDAPPIDEYPSCLTYSQVTFGSPEIFTWIGEYKITTNIDTGARRSYFDDAFLKDAPKKYPEQVKADPKIRNEIYIDLAGVQKTERVSYTVKNLELEGITLRNERISGDVLGKFAIGMSVFNNFDKYLISPDRSVICYTPSAEQPALAKKYRNIHIIAKDNQLMINNNDPQYLKSFGLQNGDIIIRINDNIYPVNATERAAELLSGTPDNSLRLDIHRKNTLHRIEL